MLPQVRETAGPAIDLARDAELARYDGLFVFDHKFPPGRPDDAVLEPFQLLTQVAIETESINLGTFIARVDRLPVEELVDSFVRLRNVAGSRVIAGLGFGDRMTAAEDEQFDVPRLSFNERLALLDEACSALSEERFQLWVGASSSEATEIAHRHGAMVALWNRGPRLEHVENFGWGSVFDESAEVIAQHLLDIKSEGAQWAVSGFRGGVEVGDSFQTLLKARHLVL